MSYTKKLIKSRRDSLISAKELNEEEISQLCNTITVLKGEIAEIDKKLNDIEITLIMIEKGEV